MFTIDYRNNITLSLGDNGVIDFALCGCDKLEDGDVVVFMCEDQPEPIRTHIFKNGVAKIEIASSRKPFDGRYCIIVDKQDGRQETVIEGKFIRKGGC